jgi:F-type H+-transporting ATPase subunit epsilon
MTIRCEIVSQDRMVFQGDADMVIIPGGEGVIGVLPNHTPLLSVLQFGVIKIKKGNSEELFTVAGGVVEVQPDQVTILADAAENIQDIDIQRAEEAKKRAEEILSKGVGNDNDNFLAIQAALRRSTLRIDAVRRYRTGRQLRGN